MIRGPQAIERIEATFPQLSASLHDSIAEGLLHLQIAEFARLIQAFVDTHASQSLDTAYQLFVELYEQGSPALLNALNVSLLENISFDEHDQHWAYDRMPPTMRTAYDDMVEYNQRIHGGD
ncbi:hypothetical protein AB1K70_14100 [Bremerella sp. JC770]|uniref:DUF7674 family protein n=1 Tax=Bremerella sp. JC770 TaxID=3232137 RepID=UPI003459D563